ncbi:MAG: hypothetical protein KF841_07870 [Phycisphaerae bacterium]|nr:hypothetical protein [Phycisphaerae bacterium]
MTDSSRRVGILALIFITALSLLDMTAAAAQVKPGTEKTVVVTGEAAGTDLNAMEQARQDALRKAVEQACGSFVTGQTKVKNYAVVHDKIMSLAAGFITESKVLERRTEGEISYCKVRAKVSTASFEAKWAQLLHTIDAEGNPRCVVVIVEDNNADDEIPPKTDAVAQSIIERFFIDKGVQLMDQSASADSRDRDMNLAAMNDDVKKMAAMAASFKADVLIRGVIEARMVGTTELSGRTLHKWNATLSIRAYHTDSAQLLMSGTYSEMKPTINENQGGDEAIRACAEKNAGRILQEIGDAWRKRQNVRRTIQVTIENCSRKDFKAFESAMMNERGVQAVRMRELVNRICQVEVDWEYDLESLATRIEQLKVDGASYEIIEQSHDRITVKVDSAARTSRSSED